MRAILIIDDDAFSRRLLHDALEDLGHPIWLAANADEALSFDYAGIGLVLCDYVMPIMDGAEVLHALRDWKGHGVPFTFVTAQPDHPRLQEAAAVLGAAIFKKPVDVQALRACVQGTLALSRK